MTATEGQTISLPRSGATVEQFQTAGTTAGREFFGWWILEKPDDLARMNGVEFLTNYHLADLNEKMAPLFHPTQEQQQAFNLAAIDEFVRLFTDYTQGMQLFNGLMSNINNAVATLLGSGLNTSTAVATGVVVPFPKR